MESKDNELKKQIDRDNKTISMILYTVTFIIISIMSSRNQLDIGGFLRAEIVGIVVLTIILFYVRIENKIDSVNNYYVLSVGYLIALLIMVVSSYLKTYNLLIVGTMFIAMAIDLNCAIIVNVFLIIIGNLLLNYNTEYTVHILIFTLISSIIAKYLKKKKFLFTVIQILLTFNITIMIILNYFKITKGFILEMVFSSISVLAAIIAVYYLYKAYLTHINKNNISKTTEELNKKLDSLISNINKPEAELAYAVDNNIQNNEIDKEKIIIEEKTFIEVAVNTNINESIEITSKNEISTNEISIQEVEIETEVDAVINADLENNEDTEIFIETTEEIM